MEEECVEIDQEMKPRSCLLLFIQPPVLAPSGIWDQLVQPERWGLRESFMLYAAPCGVWLRLQQFKAYKIKPKQTIKNTKNIQTRSKFFKKSWHFGWMNLHKEPKIYVKTSTYIWWLKDENTVNTTEAKKVLEYNCISILMRKKD